MHLLSWDSRHDFAHLVTAALGGPPLAQLAGAPFPGFFKILVKPPELLFSG